MQRFPGRRFSQLQGVPVPTRRATSSPNIDWSQCLSHGGGFSSLTGTRSCFFFPQKPMPIDQESPYFSLPQSLFLSTVVFRFVLTRRDLLLPRTNNSPFDSLSPCISPSIAPLHFPVSFSRLLEAHSGCGDRPGVLRGILRIFRSLRVLVLAGPRHTSAFYYSFDLATAKQTSALPVAHICVTKMKFFWRATWYLRQTHTLLQS